ncbi:hypothetical protein V6N13_000882 [Hibiscus sabdariffa]
MTLRVGIDEWLRVPTVQDVFSLGDCCVLVNRFFQLGLGILPTFSRLRLQSDSESIWHLGSMATIGRFKAIVDLRKSKDAKAVTLSGFISFFIGHLAYLTD